MLDVALRHAAIMVGVKEPLSSRAFFPVTERRFTFAGYRRFVEGVAARDDLVVVPLREFRSSCVGSASALLGLRHDVDESLERALVLARIENEHGVRATYYVLHTAPYWHRRDLLDCLLELQELGHEVGWHNDLVTLQCVHRVAPRAYLRRELDRLRAAGVRLEGVASHGSPWCYRLGYHNRYFFPELGRVDGFPNAQIVPTPSGPCAVETGTLEEFGFTYEAYFLGEDAYYSDASFVNGRRWHPDDLPDAAPLPGTSAIVLVHPCHWDSGIRSKFMRLARRIRRIRQRPILES